MTAKYSIGVRNRETGKFEVTHTEKADSRRQFMRANGAPHRKGGQDIGPSGRIKELISSGSQWQVRKD